MDKSVFAFSGLMFILLGCQAPPAAAVVEQNQTVELQLISAQNLIPPVEPTINPVVELIETVQEQPAEFLADDFIADQAIARDEPIETGVELASTDFADAAQNIAIPEFIFELAGTYTGVLDCNNCFGIQTSLTLNSNLSYRLKKSYLGTQKPLEITDGFYSFNQEGNMITLATDQGSIQFMIEGEQLVQPKLSEESISSFATILSKDIEEFAILNAEATAQINAEIAMQEALEEDLIQKTKNDTAMNIELNQ